MLGRDKEEMTVVHVLHRKDRWGVMGGSNTAEGAEPEPKSGS